MRLLIKFCLLFFTLVLFVSCNGSDFVSEFSGKQGFKSNAQQSDFRHGELMAKANKIPTNRGYEFVILNATEDVASVALTVEGKKRRIRINSESCATYESRKHFSIDEVKMQAASQEEEIICSSCVKSRRDRDGDVFFVIRYKSPFFRYTANNHRERVPCFNYLSF